MGRYFLVFSLLLFACRQSAQERPTAPSFGPVQPVATVDDFVYSISHLETRSRPDHYIVSSSWLGWLSRAFIFLPKYRLALRDGGTLARLTGAPNFDVTVVAVSGQPVRTVDELRHALERAAAVGELVMAVQPRKDVPDEVTLYFKAGEQITKEMLDAGIGWRADGAAVITRALARRLLSDPSQVVHPPLAAFEHKVANGRCVGFTVSGHVDSIIGRRSENTILPRLGFQEQDLLIRVNGVDLCERTMKPELLAANRYDWKIVRQGRERTLTWIVADALPAGSRPDPPKQ